MPLRINKLIKVVTGIRRCGKSTLLEIYQNWLLDQGIDERQIISINFEDIDFEELTDYRKLYEYLKERLVAGKVTYIFLDEIWYICVLCSDIGCGSGGNRSYSGYSICFDGASSET